MSYIFRAILGLFLGISHLASAAKPIDLSSSNWPKHIEGNLIAFDLVTNEKNEAFYAICEMYQISQEDLSSHLESMVIWCIYDEMQQPVGAVQVDTYQTLQQLEKQVTDQELAKKLFDSGHVFELSYALAEQYRGKGLGSKAVKTWIEKMHSLHLDEHFFALVNADNHPSIRIMEKVGFASLGNFTHDVLNENILLFWQE